MNRIKHKITVVLALFGVVFIAPVALAQVAPAGGNANIQIVDEPARITAAGELQFGQIFLPGTGTSDFGVTCGAAGVATPVDLGNIRAPSSPALECGQITLTAGDADISYSLRFEGDNTGDVTETDSSTFLETTYALYGNGAELISVDADGVANTDSSESTPADASGGDTVEFYVGGTVAVPSTAARQPYTATYELVLTIL